MRWETPTEGFEVPDMVRRAKTGKDLSRLISALASVSKNHKAFNIHSFYSNNGIITSQPQGSIEPRNWQIVDEEQVITPWQYQRVRDAYDSNATHNQGLSIVDYANTGQMWGVQSKNMHAGPFWTRRLLIRPHNDHTPAEDTAIIFFEAIRHALTGQYDLEMRMDKQNQIAEYFASGTDVKELKIGQTYPNAEEDLQTDIMGSSKGHLRCGPLQESIDYFFSGMDNLNFCRNCD